MYCITVTHLPEKETRTCYSTVASVFCCDSTEEEGEGGGGGGGVSEGSGGAAVGEQFTEIFTKRQENIELLVNLLDEFDFKVRYPTVKLLTNLLKNR